MKKLISIILMTVFFTDAFSQISVSGSGWIWQEPMPMGNGIFSIARAPDGTIYICGEHGTLLKRINDSTYITMNPVGEGDLKDIEVIENTQKIVVVGRDGAKITTNAGGSWATLAQGYANLNTVDSKGPNILVAGNNGKILLSVDHGNIFTLAFNNPASDIQKINFLPGADPRAIAIGTNGKIYRSLDGGANWLDVTNPSGGASLLGVSFCDANTGMIVGAFNQILKTTNGGSTWFEILGGPGLPLNEIFMKSASEAFAVGANGKIYRTSNGGNNWLVVYTDPYGGSIYDIEFFPEEPNNGYAWGESGQIVTTDGGLTWYNPDINDLREINRVFFFDVFGETGVCVGNAGRISTTSNNGTNWLSASSGTTLDLNSCYFINSSTGWAVGGKDSPQQRIILNTVNGGLTWTTQHTANSGMLHDVEFVNASTGVAVGNFGAILRTTNGGNNWVSISGVTWTMYDVMFLDDNTTGIAVGEGGRIFRTTNTGLNWTQVNVGGFLDTQFGVDFFDANTGISVGSAGSMYKTTDAGLNWVRLPLITQNTLKDITFTIGQTAYACGSNLGNDCSVIKTTDGGLTWTRQNTGTNKLLNALYGIDNNTVYAVGEGGTILKTTNGGAVGIQIISNEIPQTHLLSQNYPNPFNPSTKIKFEVPKSSFVSIKIYNILGKEISTIVNEYLNASTYEVEWNAINYTSGVYFYRMEAGTFIETKRMMLVK